MAEETWTQKHQKWSDGQDQGDDAPDVEGFIKQLKLIPAVVNLLRSQSPEVIRRIVAGQQWQSYVSKGGCVGWAGYGNEIRSSSIFRFEQQLLEMPKASKMQCCSQSPNLFRRRCLIPYLVGDGGVSTALVFHGR